jgi:hypothetical protein
MTATGTAKLGNYRVAVRILGRACSGPGTRFRGQGLILPENVLREARFRARTVIGSS